jgi:hypothetical protein
MKKSLILLLSLLTFGLFAQNIPPQAINFQGVAIDKDGVPVPGMDELGNPIPNKAIRVRFSILAGGSQANASYVEEHLTNTDEYGRFNLAIGRGTASVGTFSGIQWGDTAHFLKVEIDLSGIGANYSLTSIQEFLSVPYALYAKTAGNSNGNDNDPDPTNEIQNLNINGNQLSISSGNSVQLPVSTDSQTLSLNGNALSITNGNSVQLPVSTDSQTLSLTGNTLNILNGNAVQLPISLDNDTTNELQTLSLNGDTLRISNGNSVLIGSNNSTSTAVNKTPENLCFAGGQFVDFTSLFSIYNTINIAWISSKYVLAFCYNYGQTQPATLMRINRITGNFNPIATNLTTGLTYGGCTDSILFFFGNNVIYWLNINNTSSNLTSTNSYSNNTGNRLIDLKTNALYIEYPSGWYRYNYLNNSYLPLTLPSGPKTLIGADSLLVGSNIYNTNNSTIITNLNLSNYTETPVRIGPYILYESTSNPGNYARIKYHNINTGLGGDLTNNYGYGNSWGSFIDPINFSLNVIDKKLIVEYYGDPFKRINNHLINASSVTTVSGYGSGSGSYYFLSNAKELLEINVTGYVSTFKYGGFSNYGYDLSRRGNYTFVQFNESFGCHNGEIKKFPGIIIYDAL